jgi:hypothetical protein
MTGQSYSTNPKNPAGEPQPLKFQLIADNACEAVYEALVVNRAAVLGLTVTVGARIQHESPKQVTELLRGMKASFGLLSEPPDDGGSDTPDPEDGGPGLEEPFDSSRHVVIGFRLASFTGPEPAGITVTVASTAGLVPTPDEGKAGLVPAPDEGDAGDDPRVQFLKEGVAAGLSDVYHSNTSGSFTAYVTAGIGGGRLSSPGQPSKVLHAHTQRSMSGVIVAVSAPSVRAMSYTFTGSGHLIKDN